MFDQPIKPRRQPNRPVPQPSPSGSVHLNQHQRSQPLFPQQSSTSPSLQNQRVASIIQSTGHPTSSPAFTNRISSPSQNPRPHQFYASSAPSSSVALNPQQQNRPVRPPVPLFSQSTGNIQRGKMNIQGKHYSALHMHHARPRGSHPRSDLDLDEFTAFEGGASATAYSSPALASVFDFGGSVSSATTNMGTVSPQDLLIQEPFMSAPNSTALTALTSPSIYNESPDFGDSYDVSPSFGSGDFDTGSTDAWFPLFPQANPRPAVAQNPVSPELSPASKSEDLEVASALGHRRKSSATSPPSSRPSSIAGVGSRRRDKPLPPIIVEDPSDTVAMKRARNTLAARKSRERKAARLDELEEKIAKLTAERDHWKTIALAHGATD